MATDLTTVRMACADEDFVEREFELVARADETTDGKADYGCTHCGWLQRDAYSGAQELLNLATWHSEEARAEFAAKAEQFKGDDDVKD